MPRGTPLGRLQRADGRAAPDMRSRGAGGPLPPLRLLLFILAGSLNGLGTTWGEKYAGETILPEGGWKGFIRVQGGRFVDADCQEFPVTGANT